MNIVDLLEQTREETLHAFDLAEEQLQRRYAPGKWTVRELLHHISDSETVYFDRIRRILSEPRQVLWKFDQDAWAAGLDYPSLPMTLSRGIYEATRRGVIHYAQGHYARGGHLEYVHSENGVGTLKEVFDKVADHNAHHLAQIRAALTQAA